MSKKVKSIEDQIKALGKAIEKYGDYDGQRQKLLDKFRRALSEQSTHKLH